MSLLLEKRSSEVKITQEVFQTAAWNNQGLTVLLLERCCAEVFEDVMWAIPPRLKKYRNSSEVKRLVTEVVKAAASNFHGPKLLRLLLHRGGDEVRITEGVIKAAACNTTSSSKMILLFLSWRGDEVRKFITEEAVTLLIYSANNDTTGIELLLCKYPDQGKMLITEKVVKAAAQNWLHCVKIIELLVNEYREEVKSSANKEAVEEAMLCGSERCLELLLNEGKILITDDNFHSAAFSAGAAIIR